MPAEIVSLQHAAAWWAFALSFVFGAVTQRSNYCTMGAISDIANFGDWTRARMALASVGLAVVGVAILKLTGTVDIAKSFYVAPKLIWLSHIVGGLAFGFGMTLASGCGSKTLIRVGAGSLRALVTLLVMGLFAWFTLRGILGVLRVNTLDQVAVTLSSAQDIPSILGLAGANASYFAIAIGIALLVFAFIGKEFRADKWNWIGGLIVGATVIAGWYATGKVGFIAEHPETLEAAWVATNSGRPESLTFTAPPAYLLELLAFWSDRSKFVTFGVASVLGVIVGACAMALNTKTFRWEGFASTEDLTNHLVGAALMGLGGVLALGCTVGQGLSGMSTLALGSLITVAAIVAGCRAALAYQMWRLEKLS
ncbi:MAG: YeeE/YedE family protein [Burkholderiales bacterium]|nr:MAG: YeeE/YedE family protein [Burkholderiales bacterium]TAG83232.1 MAG: YeeE/YedE family protein [Betaproteobacteria bacterium]